MCQATARAERELPISSDAPRLARQFLRTASCSHHHRAVLDDAVLLVSELVTNSVQHGGPPVVLAVDCDGEGLQVRVRDGSRNLPLPRDARAGAETGRGLALVDTVSDKWGVDPVPEGKHVWFVIR